MRVLLLCLLLAAACGGSAAPASTVGGQPSDIDHDLPVPSDAVQQRVPGAWRVARPPTEVAGYYDRALPEYGWAIEKDSSQSAGDNAQFVACRNKLWRTVGVQADRNRPGNTLITINELADQHDACP